MGAPRNSGTLFPIGTMAWSIWNQAVTHSWRCEEHESDSAQEGCGGPVSAARPAQDPETGPGAAFFGFFDFHPRIPPGGRTAAPVAVPCAGPGLTEAWSWGTRPQCLTGSLPRTEPQLQLVPQVKQGRQSQTTEYFQHQKPGQRPRALLGAAPPLPFWPGFFSHHLASEETVYRGGKTVACELSVLIMLLRSRQHGTWAASRLRGPAGMHRTEFTTKPKDIKSFFILQLN